MFTRLYEHYLIRMGNCNSICSLNTFETASCSHSCDIVVWHYGYFTLWITKLNKINAMHTSFIEFKPLKCNQRCHTRYQLYLQWNVFSIETPSISRKLPSLVASLNTDVMYSTPSPWVLPHQLLSGSLMFLL